MPSAAEILSDALRHHQAGNLDEAVDRYRQALTIDGSLPQAHNNLGNALFQQGKRDQAAAHYRQALRLRPNYVQAHSNLGNALRLEGRMDIAESHCRQALRLRPDFVEAHINLGIILAEQKKLDLAITCFRRAVEIDPRIPEAHSHLGDAFERQEKLDEAVTCYRTALDINPRQAHVQNNLGNVFLKLGLLDQAVASFEEALRLQPTLDAARRNRLFCLNCDPDGDLDVIFEEYRRWGQRIEREGVKVCGVRGAECEVKHNLGATLRTPHKRPLRVGYVSPDFRQHALLRYFEPVLANHDPKNVEVFCYAEVAGPDEHTKRLQDMVQGWRWTCRMTDAQVAEQIRGDQIDILVDLAGHTANNRLGLFALKPARIQATWLGYMNTTGLSTIDYRLTDAVLDPPGQPVRDTEELWRLPTGMCCFAPPMDAPPVTPLPAVNKGHITLGSLNSLFKINDRVLDLWSKVLHAMPTASLLIFRSTLASAAKDRLNREFERRGVGSARLDLRQGSCEPGYLGIFGEIDISLDTFPCTGGVTTCESLWMGVPVVSLSGARPAGRNSAALLARVGLSDWAVDTKEQYLEMAVHWANSLDVLADLRAQLRERVQIGLCDGGTFTRQLEEVYRAMWRRWCDAPQST
jgi:predicted O-linked N-acetylglucosamine transferase (SPINDLY family)